VVERQQDVQKARLTKAGFDNNSPAKRGKEKINPGKGRSELKKTGGCQDAIRPWWLRGYRNRRTAVKITSRVMGGEILTSHCNLALGMDITLQQKRKEKTRVYVEGGSRTLFTS